MKTETRGQTGSDQCAVGTNGCAECDSSNTACTRCDPDDSSNKRYLKDGVCVTAEECTGSNDHYTDSSDTSSLACKPCSQDQKPNLAGTACVACTGASADANCVRCDEANRCAKCGDAAPYLTNDKTCATIEECAEDNAHYADSSTKTCKPCGVGEKPNAAGSQCFACPAANCVRCDAANTCARCAEGYETLDGGKTCTEKAAGDCGVANCKTCSADKKTCEECNENKYLTPTGQCISNCAALGGYYGATEGSERVCKKCGVANCETCNEQGQCQTCNSGFYPDANECKACHESCKSCSGATNADCTECPSGKALTYGSGDTKGTCGEGCTTGTGQGACKTCGLTVEGTAYCSACATDTEYPQNGVCSSTTTRTAATCKTGSVSNGACTSCNNGFFLMEGGCYETDRYPGKSVCTEAAQTGGTCQTAAPGYKLDNGNLVTCPEGCSACTSSSSCTTCADGYVKLSNAQICSKCDASCLTCETSASTCKACASGYYKTTSGSTCTSCESNSGGITGVKGCASCAAPTGSTGPVLCYLVGDGCWSSLLMCLWACLHCCSCHKYRQPPIGCVTWWQSSPEAVSRAPLPLHAEPCRPPASTHCASDLLAPPERTQTVECRPIT